MQALVVSCRAAAAYSASFLMHHHGHASYLIARTGRMNRNIRCIANSRARRQRTARTTTRCAATLLRAMHPLGNVQRARPPVGN